MKRPQAIIDEVAPRFTITTALRMLCLAWLMPAVGLVWVGFATVGIRSVDEADRVRSLDRIQAVAIMLAIFGCLVGLRWALRTMDYLPSVRRIGADSRWFGVRSHGVAAVVAMVSGLAATVGPELRPRLALVAVGAGFYALSLVSRWLLRAPLDPALPLALLGLGAGFQVTIGWLHVLYPTGALSPLLVIEGLILAWIALAAGRVVGALVPSAEATVDTMAAEPAERVSQAPAQPSLPEPAVGR